MRALSRYEDWVKERWHEESFSPRVSSDQNGVPLIRGSDYLANEDSGGNLN